MVHWCGLRDFTWPFHFWKYGKFLLKISSQLDIVCHNFLGENYTINDQSLRKHTYKKSENWRLKLLLNHTSALLYVIIKQSRLKILKYPPLFLWRFDGFDLNRHAFPQSRMVAFKSCEKMYHFDRTCHQMTLSEWNNKNSQSTEEISKGA